jgi:hypothetical protein
MERPVGWARMNRSGWRARATVLLVLDSALVRVARGVLEWRQVGPDKAIDRLQK